MEEKNIYAPPEADIEVPHSGPVLASRGARLGGAVLDSLIGMVLYSPVWFLTDFWERSASGNITTAETMGYAFLGIVIFLLANGYLMANHGQTIGKRLVGTRIVSHDSHQILPFWKLVLLRFLPVNLVAAIPVANLLVTVDALFIFGKRWRCLHDLIASTIVIKADSGR